MLDDHYGAVADLNLALELEPKDAFALRNRGEAKTRLGGAFSAGAIKDLDLALQLEPENALALRHRGDAKIQRGDFVGAIQDLDQALQLEPENASALSVISVELKILGDVLTYTIFV